MTTDSAEYNPLDYHNLTVNLVRELMARGPYPLPPDASFRGAGVYALFYSGDSPLYSEISLGDATQPIYVGKAVPAGARTGRARGSAGRGQELYNRLVEHSRSVDAATNLNLADFSCRYLVVTPLWITMAERFLIENFQPVWNVWLDGFGAHDPGAGRRQGEIPWWDAVHAGRHWASLLRQTRTYDEAAARVSAFFEQQRTNPEAVRKLAERAAQQAAESQ